MLALPALALALVFAEPPQVAEPVAATTTEAPVEVEAAPAAPEAPVVAAPVVAASARPRSRGHELPYRPEVDLPLTLIPGAAWLGTELAKPLLAPIRCRWCDLDSNAFDRGARERLRWRRPERAALTSDLVAYGVIPLSVLVLEFASVASSRRWRELHEDMLVVLEAVAIGAAIGQATKFASARQRPYADFAAKPTPFVDDPDQNLGFYSGHASFAFGAVTAAATVATLRGRRGAPAVWAVGIPLASFVAYLRVAGDRHYLSDVLVGSGVGAAIGFAVPWLLHHPDHGLLAGHRGDRLHARVGAFPKGASLTLAW